MSIIQGNAHQSSTRGFYPKVINGSLRFNDDDNAYLSWTPTSAGNRKTWTFSCWAKRGEVSNADNVLFGTAAEGDKLAFGDSRIFWFQNGSSSSYLSTSALFRDPSAWYHIVFALDTTQATAANRCKLWVNGESVAFDNNTTFPTQNYDGDINNTEANFIGRGHSGDNGTFDGYLANVHFIDGQALTASDFGETKNGVWVAKDYAGTFGTNGFYLTFEDDTEVEAFNTVLYRGNGSNQSVTGTGFAPDLVWVKNRSNPDVGIIQDTVRGPNRNLIPSATNAEFAEADNDGVRSFDSDGFTLGFSGSGAWNNTGNNYVAWAWDAGANNAVTGHSSVVYKGSGARQTISGFPFRPDLLWIKCMDSNQNHQLMDSVRGLPNNLESNTTDVEDTTNRVSSFTNDGFTLESSYSFTNTSGEDYVAWAWDAGDGDPVSNTDGSITSTVKASAANGFSIVSYTGLGNASDTFGHGLGSAPTNWMVILKNRTSGSTDWPIFHSSISSGRLKLNTTDDDFGNYPISFNTDTITLPSVNDLAWSASSNDYIAYCFHDVTGKQKFGSYTGSTGNVTVNDVGFRPGFLLVKNIDSATSKWGIVDGTRSPLGDTEASLYANASNAEYTGNLHHIEFTDEGFIVKNTDDIWNTNGDTFIYAAFAGSYSDYITDYNTDGSIDSRVKANDTTGFSIVSYDGNSTAGATVGHGLGDTPDFMIVRGRSGSTFNWGVYHASLGNTSRIYLNLTNANSPASSLWNSTSPTSSVVTLGGSGDANGPYDYVLYCWAEKAGYSKFGSYTGNGSTSGPTVTCGFKPAMIILKRTDSGGSWTISDNTRDTVNPVTPYLFPHASAAEATDSSNEIDFNSNGFQIKHDTRNNTSGATYIYAAFADTREAAFWLDQSGNDNDWQPVNLDHNDTLLDSPTNNFATMNPLQVATSGAPTFSDGNLQVSTPVSGSGNAVSTIGVTSGKYYAEVTVKSLSTLNRAIVGITGDAGATITANTNIGSLTSGLDVGYFYNGTSFTNNTETSGYGASYGVGDVIGIALNVDDSQVTFYKNGVSQGAISFNSGGTYHFAVGDGSAGGGNTFECNFGQQPFKYDPPE